MRTQLPSPKMVDEAINGLGPHLDFIAVGGVATSQGEQWVKTLRNFAMVVTGHPDSISDRCGAKLTPPSGLPPVACERYDDHAGAHRATKSEVVIEWTPLTSTATDR